MRCAWDTFLGLLPPWMRASADKHAKESLQEFRLRLQKPPELVTQSGSTWLDRLVDMDDLRYCINTASRYSPWASSSIARGYITTPGGHRIGICGDAVISNGIMSGIREPTSLCIRIARDFPGIARRASSLQGSILILGRPGSGKTTLLRDLIRQISDSGPDSVAVVDEKEELFPRVHNALCFPTGRRTDVLSGCRKPYGIDLILRNMGPGTIAVDEITAQEDCNALIQAGWCGVRLLATAHASNIQDLLTRPVYRPIIDSGIFQTVLILHPDKSWHTERMKI